MSIRIGREKIGTNTTSTCVRMYEPVIITSIPMLYCQTDIQNCYFPFITVYTAHICRYTTCIYVRMCLPDVAD